MRGIGEKKRTLRSELIHTTIGISVGAMAILGIILSVVVYRQAFQNARQDMEFYMESIQDQLERRLQFLEEAVVYLRENQALNQFLQGSGGDEEQLQKQLEQGANLLSESNLISGSYPIIRDFYIFNDRMEYRENHFYPITVSERTALAKRFTEFVANYKEKTVRFQYQTRGNVLDICFALHDKNMKPSGYCVASLEQESIQNVFSPLKKYTIYYWGLLDGQNREISGVKLKEIPYGELQEGTGELKKGRKTYYYQKCSSSFGLTSYIVIPKDRLYSDIMPLLSMVWGIFIAIILAMVTAIVFLSDRMAKPLQNIVLKIKQMGNGDFDTKLEDCQIWELQEISNSFNDATARIDRLIKEVYENQILARDSRIQYIQSQMNPHFMFNVLSMISLRLKINKDEELYKMVVAFSGLMQGKIFRKGEIEIPLKDEIEIVEFYLYLQGQRFEDMVRYEIIWDSEKLKECRIPRLSIEPLVENAMIHGLEPKGEEGYIHVEIRERSQEQLWILVEDSGVGFDMKNWNERTQGAEKHPRVGIMNIQRLIQNLYGESYGIDIWSEPGKGTRVEMILPNILGDLK